DQQVKIRGFRIELGEIEYVLSDHPDIEQVTVISREDQPGDQRLEADIILEESGDEEHADIRRWAAQRVPDYMVPSACVMIDAFPVTPLGKLDHKAKPPPV